MFDVATTGDEELAKSYLIEQELALRGTSVQLLASKPKTRRDETLVITATVLPLGYALPTPTGLVTFLLEGVPAGSPVELDKRGRATFTTKRLARGDHRIRATYAGGGAHNHHPSSSPTLLHTVGEDTQPPHGHGPHDGHT